MNLSNRTAISYYKKLAEFKQQKKDAKKEVDRLNKLIEKLGDKIDIGSSVSFIYKGIPIACYWGDDFECVSDFTARCGNFYKLADNKGFRVRTYTNNFGSIGEEFKANPVKTKEEAKTLVLEWIVSGVRP